MRMTLCQPAKDCRAPGGVESRRRSFFADRRPSHAEIFFREIEFSACKPAFICSSWTAAFSAALQATEIKGVFRDHFSRLRRASQGADESTIYFLAAGAPRPGQDIARSEARPAACGGGSAMAVGACAHGTGNSRAISTTAHPKKCREIQVD
jgi:hypothetical protein